MVGQDASTKLVDNTTHAFASRRAKHSLRIKRKDARFTQMQSKKTAYVRISLRWYRCSGPMVPRGADAWYRL